MGRDRAISVADINGELYDVKGVWVGDGSACPTSLGANPMVTIMSLADRTADRISESMAASSWQTSGSRQGFGASQGMGSSGIPDLNAVPAMATNMVREMVGLMSNPGEMVREMTGIMANPMNMFALGQRMLFGKPGSQPAASAGPAPAQPAAPRTSEKPPMYSHIIELTAKPGQGRQVVTAIRDQAIPQVIRPSKGFIDEIVLLSDTDPNHVTAISFWTSQQDAELFYATGFARVSALLQSYLSAPPSHQEFIVAASTNDHIVGWGT